MELILASTSPYRRELLARLGLPFVCVDPDFDERAAVTAGMSPAEIAASLARGKATAVARGRPEAIVIGGDQVVALDDEVLGKPGGAAEAAAQLARLAGREHRLITATAIADRRGVEVRIVEATLTMRRLTSAEIERYVAADAPYDCAGSYKIERLGIALFDRIDASDQTAIVGLPLMTVAAMLRERGLAAP